ncbi:type II secretion system F family protein [Nocardioides sp.]|uniref:type II secretion system F family protein n=1 Tax=Nocardioides sp. TaxID=35761 RepID=UPI002ED4A870
MVTPALLAGLGTALWFSPAPERPRRDLAAASEPPASPRPERVRRARLVWPASCLVAGWLLWPGWGGVVLGAGAAAIVHRVVAGAEPLEQRRERAAVRADLPLIVLFLATALRAGASTTSAVRQAAAALPGPAADRLLVAADRLALGVPPERVWETLAGDTELGAVGRALARAERTGAAVAAVVERLADDLAGAARAEVEDRARAVGVRAAVPLGVCLLPSFLLLGIVPLVAALVDGLGP